MTAEDGDRLPVVLMASLPGLTIRFGVGFLRLQARRKRGVRQFRRALVKSGMDPRQAASLAQRYHDAASVRVLLRMARVSSR